MSASKSLTDLMWVVVVAAAAATAGALLGINEVLLVRNVVADAAVFLVLLSIGLVWYTWRRLQERKIELEMLQQMEAELVAAKEEAEAASHMKDEFLANVSHELRTPLNGVVGMINLLRLTELSEDQREYCDLAMESAEQQLSVIGDLIDFSRIETGRLMLARRAFDPGRVAEAAVEAFQGQARDKGLGLKFELLGRVPTAVLGDDGRFRQVLLNLLENGIKYTEKGEVKVSLASDCSALGDSGKCMLTIEVSDTGIGISEDKQQAIFDKFTQVDSSLTRLHAGSGLGLTIVKSLTELMHGQVAVASTQGEGATFTLSIPFDLARESYADDNVLEAVRDRPILSGYRVLVVEDERVNRASLAKLIEKRGHIVNQARSGREAIAKLERDTYDCVLLDIHMPGMSGVETARHIRTGKSGKIDPNIAIIAVTALTYEEDRHRCLEAGMDGCVFKPADPDEVVEEMVRVMSGRPIGT